MTGARGLAHGCRPPALSFQQFCDQPPICTWLNEKSLSMLEQGETPEFVSRRRMSDDPPTPAGETMVDSVRFWSEPSQTLIFLDWDDTLFPSTEVFDRWGISSRPETWDDLALTEEQEAGLEKWRSALFVYLRIACALSESCVIVTNAAPGWVASCLERFAPNLEPLFKRSDGPRVVYARMEDLNRRNHTEASRGTPTRYSDNSLTELELEESLTKAKFAAMRREAKAFYSRYPHQTWKNILSVGDAKYEHNAAQDLAFTRQAPSARENLRLKALLTTECPRLADLTYRLRLSSVLFPAYVSFDGDLDLDMNTPEELRAIACALDMPELASVIRQMPIREEDELSIDDDMDEMAVMVHNRLAE